MTQAPRLYAWAHNVSAAGAPALAKRFPGLGLVLNLRNLDAAERLKRPPIAYVTDLATATRVATMAAAGVPFRAAIYRDELNADGPSGRYLDPVAYAAAFALIADALVGGPPLHTMGLQPAGGVLRQLFRCRTFDDAYHAQLPPAAGRAFNPNQVRLAEVHRALALEPGPWILSPAPFRGWWDRANEPVKVRQWAELAKHPRVRAVALWALREVHGGPWFGDRWQTEHGLLDRHGDETVVGRELRRVLG